MLYVLVVLLAGFAVLFVRSAEAASATTKVVIAYAAMNARVTPLWAAQEQGFFAKYGVDAELIFVKGAPTLNAALMSGDIHMGYTGATAVLGAAVGGADLKILASFTNKVTYDLVTQPSIKRAEDLRGKRFGVTSIGGTLWMGAILGMEQLGLDPVRDNIIMVVSGDDTVRAQAVLAGTLDATALDGVLSRLLRARGFTILAELSKLNIPFAATGVVARKAYLEKHSSTVENVLKALLEGNAFAMNPQTKALVLTTIQRRLRITEHEAEEGRKDILMGMALKPYPLAQGLRNIQRLMKLTNPRVEKLKVEDLVDDRFVRKLDESRFIDRLYSSYGVK